MPGDAKKISKALLHKGFQERNSKDIFYHLYVEGKKTTIFTKISHGEKEIHDGLMGAMSRELKLKKSQFLDLINCPLSLDDYLTLLKASNYIV
ncbi:MAG: type II toxin-antitoxin system HicA family toxin [Phycisphaerae bacterium]